MADANSATKWRGCPETDTQRPTLFDANSRTKQSHEAVAPVLREHAGK